MASALALAALMLAAPAEPIALDDLIGFSDRSRCEPAAPFRRILDQLWAMRSNHRLELRRVVPRAYEPAFGNIFTLIGNSGNAIVSVDTKAIWHGLRLTSITLRNSDMPGVKLEMAVDGSAAQARAALTPLGFKFGSQGDGTPAPFGLEPRQGVTTVMSCTLPDD